MANQRDGARTQRYIDEAMGRFLRITPVVERAHYAWAYIRGVRRLGDDDLCRQLKIAVPRVEGAPEDLNLADAEHYLYARFLAGSTGDPSASSLVVGYELWKTVKYVRGREKDLRTDPRFPVLPPSIDAVNWGLQGIQAGLQDYRDLHGGKFGKTGSAIEANRSLATSQYQSSGTK
jgi:hypothetical protein